MLNVSARDFIGCSVNVGASSIIFRQQSRNEVAKDSGFEAANFAWQHEAALNRLEARRKKVRWGLTGICELLSLCGVAKALVRLEETVRFSKRFRDVSCVYCIGCISAQGSRLLMIDRPFLKCLVRPPVSAPQVALCLLQLGIHQH